MLRTTITLPYQGPDERRMRQLCKIVYVPALKVCYCAACRSAMAEKR